MRHWVAICPGHRTIFQSCTSTFKYKFYMVLEKEVQKYYPVNDCSHTEMGTRHQLRSAGSRKGQNRFKCSYMYKKRR